MIEILIGDDNKVSLKTTKLMNVLAEQWSYYQQD